MLKIWPNTKFLKSIPYSHDGNAFLMQINLSLELQQIWEQVLLINHLFQNGESDFSFLTG